MHNHLFVALVTLLCCLLVIANASKNLRDLTGIEILKNQMNIRRINAHFNFKENKASYMVRFCGKKKKEPLCFVTDMFEEGSKKQTDGEASDVFRNINLWMKLISTLNGKNNYNIHPAPDMKNLEGHSRCRGTHYLISKGPNKKIIDEIIRDSKLKMKTNRCTGEPSCERVCIKGDSEECDEIRLHCLFFNCKCYKKVNLSSLRTKKSKQTQRT